MTTCDLFFYRHNIYKLGLSGPKPFSWLRAFFQTIQLFVLLVPQLIVLEYPKGFAGIRLAVSEIQNELIVKFKNWLQRLYL